MNTAALLGGALVGLGFGLGLWLVVVRMPGMRRIDLDQRVGPYLARTAPRSALLGEEAPVARGPFAVLEQLLSPVMADAVAWVERLTGGNASVRRRLEHLGAGSMEQFRAEQVVWGALGLAAGIIVSTLSLVTADDVAVLPLLVLTGMSALAGVLARDYWLSRQVRAREEAILNEFPTVAELLALSVGAGEGPVAALERVSGSCRGELSGELRRTLADARAGASLVTALEAMAARTSLPSLARFVDGVAVAVERGTPLADVLRAQAQDVRESGRRALMETGGRKEIAMMVPVVFLVLPIAVVFVVYPGFAALRLGG